MGSTPFNLARNIRQLREARGLSQEQAAKMAELPRPTWGNLESGSANPTLSVLLRVSAVLQVSLEEIVGEPKAEAKLIPVSKLKTQRRGNAVVRKILPDALPGCELDRMELPAGAVFTGIPHRVGTREYLTCERGSIRLRVQGESWDLGEGDVVVFRGDQKHSYQNVGRSTSIGYSVVLLGSAQ
jgi:XRE family transcriptional regulator, regulator of sulfur utilization